MLWDRFMEKNRRDVEERAEQLKSIGNMAALIAGFAVVAFLEFSADTNTKALEIMFGLTTALVVRPSPQRISHMIATHQTPITSSGPGNPPAGNSLVASICVQPWRLRLLQVHGQAMYQHRSTECSCPEAACRFGHGQSRSNWP